MKEALAVQRLFLLVSLICGIMTSACVAVWVNKMPVLVLIFHVPNAVLLVSLLTIPMIITARGQWLREHSAVLWIAGHCFASTATIVMITEKFVFARLYIVAGFVCYIVVLADGYMLHVVNSLPSSKTSTHLRSDVPDERAIPEVPAVLVEPPIWVELDTPTVSSFEPEDLHTPSNLEYSPSPSSPSPLPTGGDFKAKSKPLLTTLSPSSSLQSIESLPLDSP